METGEYIIDVRQRKPNAGTKKAERKRIVIPNVNNSKTTFYLNFNSIVYGKNIYCLTDPLQCEVLNEDKMITVQQKDLNIISVSSTIDEAISGFEEDFSFTYDRLMQLNDDQLGKEMCRAKSFMKFIVKNVEYAGAESKKS